MCPIVIDNDRSKCPTNKSMIGQNVLPMKSGMSLGSRQAEIDNVVCCSQQHKKSSKAIAH